MNGTCTAGNHLPLSAVSSARQAEALARELEEAFAALELDPEDLESEEEVPGGHDVAAAARGEEGEAWLVGEEGGGADAAGAAEEADTQPHTEL